MRSELARHWMPQGARAFERAANLSEFRTIVRAFMDPRNGQRNRFLFRGAANKDWDLKPGLLRVAKDLRLAERLLYTVEKAALEDFQSRAHLYIRPECLPASNMLGGDALFRWWQLMQHHGGKTRLLDWTASAYVAAYFAVADRPDEDGAVWMVENGALSDRMTLDLYAVDFQKGLPLATGAPPSRKDKDRLSMSLGFLPCLQPDERMAAQRGWFSCATVLTVDHGEALAAAFRATGYQAGYYCRKVIVPSKAKPRYLRDLWRMNISGETLYPGIDGLGRAAGELPLLLMPDKSLRFQYKTGQLVQSRSSRKLR
jgi:hypothetical protein